MTKFKDDIIRGDIECRIMTRQVLTNRRKFWYERDK